MNPSEGYTLSAGAIAEIRRIPQLIRQEVERRMRQEYYTKGDREKQVRVAKTTSFNHPYPSGQATQYEVVLGRPDFDDTVVGLFEDLDFEKYSTTEGDIRIARLLEKEVIEEGTEVYIQLVHGQWYIIRGGASVSGSAVLIQLEGQGYETGDCADRQDVDVASGIRAKILRRPCGVQRVFGEDGGYLTVFDEIGWLEGQSGADISGKIAFAHLMEGSYTCEWILDIPNLFQERQFVQDWYVSGLDIVEEKVNARVFSWCQLPDEIFEGVDCATDSYIYGQE